MYFAKLPSTRPERRFPDGGRKSRNAPSAASRQRDGRLFAPKEASMTRLTPVLASVALAAILAYPAGARAFDEQTVLSCAFRQALAILTCKNPENYSFLGVREGTYVFNTHYAKGFAEFYVQQNGDLAVFSSRVWHGRMPSGRIIRDYPAGCVTVAVDPLPCSRTKVARCCGSP
jgi:hypothetical protein